MLEGKKGTVAEKKKWNRTNEKNEEYTQLIEKGKCNLKKEKKFFENNHYFLPDDILLLGFLSVNHLRAFKNRNSHTHIYKKLYFQEFYSN